MIDAAHSSVTFKISHIGLSYVHGRFNDFAGGFTLDSGDPAKSSFKLNIKSQSMDTNNAGRDTHLRSPDFFNAKQFSSISFTSTAVKPVEGGYEVTGDLKLHGETKPVTFTLKGGSTAEFPRNVREPASPRISCSSEPTSAWARRCPNAGRRCLHLDRLRRRPRRSSLSSDLADSINRFDRATIGALLSWTIERTRGGADPCRTQSSC